MSGIADTFKANGLTPWWTIAPSQTFGGNRNGEWGEDFPMPANSPVGSLSGGRVVYVGQDGNNPGSSIGYIVQVQNEDGSVFHYQHLRSAAVHTGDYVQPGSIIGSSGGCPAGGYGSNGQCTFTDQNSTGPHIEVRWASSFVPGGAPWFLPWQNPSGIFNQYASGNASSIGSLLGSSGSGTATATLANTSTSTTLSTKSSSGAACMHPFRIGAPLGQSWTICADGLLDVSIRGVLIFTGIVAVLMAIVLFMGSRGNLQQAQETVGKVAPFLV